MLVREHHVVVVPGDIDDDFLSRAAAAGRVAWDIETSGLDWRTDAIGTCQVAAAGLVAIVQLNSQEPARLRSLLEDAAITKVFHHAPFDLRFMVHHWAVQPASIACTKVASKVLDPGLDAKAHSLKPVLWRELGIEVDKSLQVSDWTRADLSADQLAYAATDVLHLEQLLNRQTDRASRMGLKDLLGEAFRFLPTRAHLDVRGSGDVYAY